MKKEKSAIIIGGGLAGCEAAWQLIKYGISVTIYEMKPVKFSSAHKSPTLAELVCSNSLRASSTRNAAGLLKEEMRRLDSIIMNAADRTAIPAGRALAVDRIKFSQTVEDMLVQSGSSFNLVREEVTILPSSRPVVIATGPLTSDTLASNLQHLIGQDYLYFYDAISPIIDGETIDFSKAFWGSRYGEGDDYLNIALDKSSYLTFWQALLEADVVPPHPFEDPRFFEGCLPIEVIARRGPDTLRFGPMKPVGLKDPKTGCRPYAVLQLRRENLEGTLFNMVGFQTKLKWTDQRRVFRLIPGLERAEFIRYGSIHRNTFVNSPTLVKPSLELKNCEGVFLAGQITGVEGYIESTAMGLLAGLSVACYLAGQEFLPPPPTTAMGALLKYITSPGKKDFQPMNVNFGLLPPLKEKIPARDKGLYYATRSLQDLEIWKKELLNRLKD